jgi:hypothetical protein
LIIFAGRRGGKSFSFLKGGTKMKKEVMQNVGNIAEEMVKGIAGKSPAKNRTSGDTAGNIADSIVDTITGALGGKSGGGGRGGSRGGGCGRGRL